MMPKQPGEERGFELEEGSSMVNGKYKVLGKVGSGTSSSVHAVSLFKNQKQVVRAIKVEATSVKEPQIATEVAVLKALRDNQSNEQGFIQIYEYGFEANYNYLIMTLLGPSLDQLLKLCGGSFSIKTTMVLSLQVLDRLETLHRQGYTHGDIAPENFLVGLNSDSPFVFMVDFGRSKRYKSRSSGQHIAYKENVHSAFNPVFASINAHNNVQGSRRDDMESLLYMLIYLRLGKLPWARNNEAKRQKYDVSAEEFKKRLTPEMLCHKMPLEVIDLMYYVKSIEFHERPDYDFLRKMLYRCLEREAFDTNVIYDWNCLEDIDFKVYAGEPKIVLRGAVLDQHEGNRPLEATPNAPAYELDRELEGEEDEASQLYSDY